MYANKPIIIAHRGASGYLPEHTLAAYALAIDMGADYIEPDLVITKDGVLIARHENEISQTTDISLHPEFAHLQTSKIIDGKVTQGWFTEDLTLAEIKTLYTQERIPHLRPQNTAYNGIYPIPTLTEIIDLVKEKTQTTGRKIGIYPETKHPTYFQNINLPLEDSLITLLHHHGYQDKNAPIFIQSFEVANLQYLAEKTQLPLVQLINHHGQPYDFTLKQGTRTYQDLITPTGLSKIASYAQAIGVHKDLIVPRNHQNYLQAPTSLIQDAHHVNLLVHGWTFRNENEFLPANFADNPQQEYELFYSLGIDGIFSDFPNIAIFSLGQFSNSHN
ncbi:glycerophosphodiester phosphodiesterase [Calothrix sp. 336/3]|uniref:glycerophosphodiester phosphodiesterase n=1 Tax=Calothrix sp. 336/3 TaxID=1337936 RepID=UPI000624B4B2|nr:glycerophosphodiester phosphodiesterase [Calothrix sp. 336/3]AKG21554.1 glycerophosphodiester phosphodiesterase [Calothrix sp. 336/3]